MVEIAESATADPRERAVEGDSRDVRRGIDMPETDPAALERDIERTRAQLARTVDAIADRVSPKRVAERGVARFQSNAKQLAASVGDLVTGNGHRPVPPAGAEGEPWAGERRPPNDVAPLLIGVGAIVAVGALVILLRRRRRHR